MEVFLAQNIKFLRYKKKMLSVRVLAEKTNLNQKCLEHYENGYARPTIETIKVLADFFGFSIEDLCFTDLQIQCQ